MTEDQKKELTIFERLFKAAMMMSGLVGVGASSYYMLVKEQEIPFYVFGMFGVMMGLGNVMIKAYKEFKP